MAQQFCAGAASATATSIGWCSTTSMPGSAIQTGARILWERSTIDRYGQDEKSSFTHCTFSIYFVIRVWLCIFQNIYDMMNRCWNLSNTLSATEMTYAEGMQRWEIGLNNGWGTIALSVCWDVAHSRKSTWGSIRG